MLSLESQVETRAPHRVRYAHGTELVDRADGTTLRVGLDDARGVASAHATMRDPLLLREALLTLARCVVPERRASALEMTTREQYWSNTLDPLVTIHRDQLTCEVFSDDGAAYGMLAIPATALAAYQPLRPGTASADLAWAVGNTLQGMRSSAPTQLHLGSDAMDTFSLAEPVQRSIALSDDWMRAVARMHLLLLRRPFVFAVHPGDFMSLITYLAEHHTSRSPRSLRYELVPGAPISAVLEPWEERFTFHQTRYAGYQRSVRLWGRMRMLHLAPLLPYVDRVTVAIYGRGLPHVYTCHLGGMQLVLAINGWSGNDQPLGGLELTLDLQARDLSRVEEAAAWLATHESATREELMAALGVDLADLEPVLYLLVRAGRAMFDVTANRVRHRPLLPQPLDVARLFQPDPRALKARRLVESGVVTEVALMEAARPSRASETRVQATVSDDGAVYTVQFTLDESGRMTYGRCGCPFFQSYIMTRGPCEHLLAARLAFEARPESGAKTSAVVQEVTVDPALQQELDDIPF